MRSKCPAMRCGPPTATATCSSSPPVRRGDRVVAKTRAGELIVGELKRKTAKTIELQSFAAEHSDRVLPLADVLWIARILWASQ